MSITWVNGAGANATSVSLPSGWAVGDIAVVVTFGSSAPTVPSGWKALPTTGMLASGSLWSTWGYRVLQSGDTSTGTWTNAVRLCVAIWKGVDANRPIDLVAAWSIQTSGTTYTAPALTPAASSVVGCIAYDGSLWVAGMPSSMTSRQNVTGGFSIGDQNTTGSYSGDTWDRGGSSSGHRQVVVFGLAEPSPYPRIADVDTTSGTVTSNSSSWTLTYPTNIAAGDLLLGFAAVDGNHGNTWPTGWGWGAYLGPANELNVGVKVADGTETGTFTFSTASEQGSWMVVRIPAGTWYGGTLPTGEFVSADDDLHENSLDIPISAAGTSTTPDPPSLNPANWDTENSLWIAAMSADTSRTVSAYPSSPDTFTNTGSLVSGGSGGATLAWGRLEKNAASVDPGTFTISSSDDWAAVTIAIRPFVPASPASPTDDPRRVRVYRQVLAH